MLGWCMSGDHKSCPGKIQRWYHGKAKQGRKTVGAVVMLDEFIVCDCKHHGSSDKNPVRRRRRKT